MKKILSAAQMRELDKATIAREPISSIDLMERASRAFVTWFTGRFDALHRVAIVCGTGNNGGDGLAVARMLDDWGYKVAVWIVRGGSETPDFSANRSRLPARVPIHELNSAPESGVFGGHDILVDALFGTGLSRPLEGHFAAVVAELNRCTGTRIAIDMPSGLSADAHSSGEIVRADHTVTFQLPKLPFFFPQYAPFVGEWTVVDIGLDRGFLQSVGTPYFFATIKSVRRLLRTRGRFSHKGTFGHALLVAGSRGKMGAAVLSARAVLRAGAGLLTVHAPGCGYEILQTSVPEAMVNTDGNEEVATVVDRVDGYSAAGVGPGLGTRPETAAMLRSFLERCEAPVVFDADALNILAANREMLHLVRPGCILTPHPKEFERIAGSWSHDFDRLRLLREVAQRLRSVIVLKGAYTAIASPDGEVCFNATGNAGMATGGTGDVLTGVLTGLLAQGYSAMDAAVLGVYLHGLSGDLAVLEKGMEALIASDVVDFLPSAFRQLHR